VNSIKTKSTIASETLPDRQALDTMRQDLAASFRWLARLGMHEPVANHFSLAVEPSGRYFLMNPRGRHFSRMRASDLILLDTEDASTLDRPDAPDPTAWHNHGRIHARCPSARSAMHLHPRYATALASLEDSGMPPIDQNTMRVFGRLAIDEDFGGMVSLTMRAIALHDSSGPATCC
jgi:ribulose-5-phosphate 4-epimerase/fuculose-1-phosphate aldolase